ncbi:acyltransferase family protein [Paracoccus tibetensis]|uniref:Uncharacterized membrane protein YcfT n=1 Tax=Paracoccus tibetensis TaxID=336292 RepID=A0A1G5J5M0_9RHOB|nr:acyltransferase [Paracoccus tibetensis]SCY83572.1 Uncharacterized membrane protein YcfT [Paracoccus tibetensis]
MALSLQAAPVQGDHTASRSRLLWMDIVRGAAILAVITFHSVTIVERYEFEAGLVWRNLNETLKLFRMPILIFLSGMLLPRSLAKPMPEYFWGKVRAILWPFFLWSTIYAGAAGVDLTSPYEVRHLYTGGSHLWFLGFIFVYYIAAKPLSRVDPLLVAAAAFTLSMISPDGAKYSERILYLMSLFFLGSAVSRHGELIGQVLRSPWIWVLTPLVAAAGYATARHDLNFGPNWVVVSAVGFLFFAAIAQRLEGVQIARPLVWIGQRSIVFYVSHAIFILLIARLAEGAGVTSYAATAAAAIALSLTGGWALATGMDRWAAVRWLFVLPGPARRSPA